MSVVQSNILLRHFTATRIPILKTSTVRIRRLQGALQRLVICSVLLSFSNADAQTSQVILQSIDGKKTTGQIKGFDIDSVLIQTNDGDSTVFLDQLDSIDTEKPANTPIEPSVHIRLIDGTNLHAKTFTIASRELTAELYCQTKLTLETRNIESIRFKTYDDNVLLGKQWRKIREDKTREGDAIVVNRSDELDAVEGIVGDTLDGKLGFSIGERTARVSLEKLDAILFYHAAGREMSKTLCEMILTDNSRISVRRLAWKSGSVIVTAVSGSQFPIRLDAVSKINFSLGRAVFLSNLEPSTNDWRALVTSPAIMEKLRKLKLARTNESFSGQPLSLKFLAENEQSFQAETKQFEHGFAIQGGGKLAFAIDGEYEKLSGLVGFDPKASRSGHVKLIVLVDGKALFERELIHRKMTNPILLDLDIKGANRVVFQVEYHDGRSTGDQIHLVNLKVSK